MSVEILRGVVGLQAYGLAAPDSDVGTLAVHVASTREMLGLSVTAAVSTTRRQTSPDFTSHELGKFCDLALLCTPTLLELLWLDDYEAATAAGRLLVANRTAFLSTAAVRDAYCGYVRSEAQKVSRVATRHGIQSTVDPARIEGMGRRAARLLLQCEGLLTVGALPLDLSAYRDHVAFMGNLAVNVPHDFAARIEMDAHRLDVAPSALPDDPDLGVVDELVRGIRTEQVRRDLDAGL